MNTQLFACAPSRASTLMTAGSALRCVAFGLLVATGLASAATTPDVVDQVTVDTAIPLAATTRFTIKKAEVTDNATGLIWMRCSEGQELVGNTCSGDATLFVWEDALADALSEADATGVAWRLPNIKELASLVDHTKSQPSIDSTTFPDTPAAIYWSSSPLTGGKNGDWAVNFDLGGVGNLSHNLTFAARLVRGTGH